MQFVLKPVKEEILKSVDESIEHWEENLRLLKKSTFQSKLVGSHKILGIIKCDVILINYSGQVCALCLLNLGDCVSYCPLGRYWGGSCGDTGTIWDSFSESKTKKDRIKYAKQMIEDLKACKSMIF